MSSEKLPHLLIVEDDRALQKQIRWAFDQYEALTADDRESALQLVRRYQPPVVTMDLGLPPDADSVSEGFKLLEEILTLAPDTKIIVLTGQNDRANALRAIALGAYDFFAKPFEIEMLGLTIQRAYRLHELQQENKRLQAMQQPDVLSGLLTRDPELLRVCRTIERVSSPMRRSCCSAKAAPARNSGARVHESSPRRASASWPSTARRFRRTCWKASSLVTRRGLSPARRE
jgi:two-component system NtrC family response regulator